MLNISTCNHCLRNISLKVHQVKPAVISSMVQGLPWLLKEILIYNDIFDRHYWPIFRVFTKI